jgi:alkyl hydroperoxide reductase subunit AhpC
MLEEMRVNAFRVAPVRHAGLAVLALALIALALPVQAAPVVGEAAPAFSAKDTVGKSHSLSDYRGKTVVLEWTNHECPFVRKHYGSKNMQSLQTDAATQGVVWLSIVSSAPGQQGYVNAAEADQLTQNRGAQPSAVILDPEGSIGRLYAARTTPHMFVIDDQGKIAFMGAIDDKASSDPADIAGANNYVKLALAALKDGKQPATSSAKPYGCSVKYGQ